MPPNWPHILHRAHLADAAYPSPDAKSPWNDIEQRVRDEFGYAQFAKFDTGGTQAFLCANAAEVCFVFRGSDDLPDWIRNLKFVRRSPLVDAAGNRLGRVHRGFLQSTRQVERPLVAQIRDWLRQRPGRALHGVGHSLGAACAALTAIRHLREFKPRLTLFGCPRIGNRRFAREYNFTLGDRTLSIRNNNDVVTLSPFWNRPIGRQWYLTSDGRALDHPGWWFRAGEQVKANAKWAGHVALQWASGGRFGSPPTLLEQVSDHFMLNYVAAIERVTMECGGSTPLSFRASTRRNRSA